MNNIMLEHQVLPEEMLTKKQVLFVQFLLWRESRYSDFPTLSKTLTSKIPRLKPEKGTPFGRSLPEWVIIGRALQPPPRF